MSTTTEPTDPAVELISDVTAQGQLSTSSNSVNSSTIKDDITTVLNEGTHSKDRIEPDSDDNPTTSLTGSKENSQNRNDDLDAKKDEDEDEDENEDYEDDEDDEDSDPDFPKFDDTPKGRIVGPVAGQKPKPRPK